MPLAAGIMEPYKIRVGVRLRPPNEKEKNAGWRQAWSVNENALTSSAGSFVFDRVFDQCMSNQEVFEAIGEPIISSFLEGFNGTIFAYGQTASGKTHTMMGSRGEDGEPGLIPIALASIFHYMEEQSSHREFILRCSYLEIYNEVLTDLLDNQPGKKVSIKEDSQRNVSVQGLTEHRIIDCNEAVQLILAGENVRRFAETIMNERSSRSHTIYRLTLESKEMDGDMVKVSVLNLVDLAGSEKAHMLADQQRFKEGVRINLSLLHLGIVIAKLSDGEGFIPFRESKLTRILQNSLGGNAKTSIVCTISPVLSEETLNTLKFAGRAMRIQNKPQVNELPTSHEAVLKKLAKMEEENRKLRLKLTQEGDDAEKESLMLSLQARELEKEHLKQTVEALKKFIFGGNSHGDTKDKDKTSRRQTVGPMSLIHPSSPVLSKRPDMNTALLQSNRRSIDKELKKRRLSFFPSVPMESPVRLSVDSDLEEEGCNSPHVHFDMAHVQVFDGSMTPCPKPEVYHKETQTNVEVLYLASSEVQTKNDAFSEPICSRDSTTQTEIVNTPVQRDISASNSTVSDAKGIMSVINSTDCFVQTDSTAINSTDCCVQTDNTALNSSICCVETDSTTTNSTDCCVQTDNTALNSSICCVQTDNTAINSTDCCVQTDNTAIDSSDCGVQTDNTAIDSSDCCVQTDNVAIDSTDCCVQTDNTAIDSSDCCVQTDNTTVDSSDCCVQTDNTTVDSSDCCVQTDNTAINSTDCCVQTDNTTVSFTHCYVQTDNTVGIFTDCCVQTDNTVGNFTDCCVQTDNTVGNFTDCCVQTDNTIGNFTDCCVQTVNTAVHSVDHVKSTVVNASAQTDSFLQVLQDKVCDFERKYEQAEFERLEVDCQLEEVKEKLTSITGEKHILEDENTCLKGSLDYVQAENQKLQSKCSRLMAETDKRLVENDANLKFVQLQLAQADEEKEALKQQFQLLTSAHSCLQEEKSMLQKEISTSRHGHEIIQQLESQLSRATEENQELVKNYSHLQSRMSTVVESNSLQVITLEQKLTSLENENRCLHEHCSEMESNIDMGGILQTKVDEAQKEILHLKVELSKLTDQSEKNLLEKEQIRINLAKLSEEKQKLDQDYNDLQVKLDSEMGFRLEEVGILKQQLLENEAKLLCMVEENERLIHLSEASKAQHDELSTTKTSYENLKQELQQILQQNQTLEQERDKYRQWLDEFEDRVQIAEKKRMESRHLLQETTEKLSALKEDHSQLSSAYETLQSDMRARVNNLQAANERFLKENAMLAEELQDCRARSTQESCTADHTKNEELQRKFKIVYDRKTALELEVIQYSQELDELEEKLEKQTLQQKAENHQLTVAKERIKLLMDEKAYLNQKLEEVKSERKHSDNSAMAASVQELEARLKKAVAEKRNIENQRNKFGQQINALKNKIEELEMDNKRLDEESRRLKKARSEGKWTTKTARPVVPDPVGYGCGVSLEYKNYQLELELGEAQKKIKSLSTHNSTMKELEEMKRKLSAKEQYCHTLEMKLAESAKKPLQDVNVNQQIPTKPSLVKTVQGNICDPQEKYRETSVPSNPMPAFEWNETVTESKVDQCKQQ